MFCFKKTDISRMEIIAIVFIVIGYLLELHVTLINYKEEQIERQKEKEEIEKNLEYYKNKLKNF